MKSKTASDKDNNEPLIKDITDETEEEKIKRESEEKREKYIELMKIICRKSFIDYPILSSHLFILWLLKISFKKSKWHNTFF